jgi:4,5-dihydroxyphthalate decarboxylase
MHAAASKKIKLRSLLADKPWNVSLKNGTVRSDLFDFDFHEVEEVSDYFKAMVRENAYDCGEMAIVTYLQAMGYGKPFVVLPFVVSGTFHHKSAVYNTDKGNLTPATLAGHRVGVRTYSQTTGVWVRGILQHEYDTDVSKVTWVTFDAAHLAEYADPPNCERAPPGKKLIPMLLAGELDGALPASLASTMPNDPRVKTLIPDPAAAAKAWAAKYGVTPINHMFVVTKALCEQRPEIVRSLYDMLAACRAGTDSTFPLGFGGNWKALELVSDYAYEQKVIPRRFTVDELFSESAKVLGR